MITKIPTRFEITRRRLLGGVGALAAAPAILRSTGADAAVTLKLGHSGSNEWQGNLWAKNFAEAIEATNLGVKIEIYPNAQLGQDPALAQATKLGTLDITVNGPVLQQYVPSFAVMDLPFLFRDLQDAHKWQDGSVGAKIKSDCESAGFHFLGWIDIGMRSVTTNRRPIETVADFKGLKLRVPPGKVFVSTFQALGASVQSINFGELYTALQQGVVDGQENPPTTIRVQKYYEVQKYLSLTRHIASFAFSVMNKKVYESQPEAVRKAIDEAGRTATEKGRVFLEQDENASLEFLRKQGMQINEPKDISGFRAATRAVIDEAGPVLAPLVKEILKT
ncbi:MAG TPA: TRAP transporter substrate-binding protein [Pseudorhodoplanes sp.]|nr:TRAP transporter substrate-binding protein [Pseudorhodoplanes sp.]